MSRKAEPPPAVQLAAATLTDADLERRVRALSERIISHAERIMRVGTEAEKSRLIPTILPVLQKALSAADENREQAEMRTAFTELQNQIRNARPSELDTRARVAAVRAQKEPRATA